jgi:hypothetical protein
MGALPKEVIGRQNPQPLKGACMFFFFDYKFRWKVFYVLLPCRGWVIFSVVFKLLEVSFHLFLLLFFGSCNGRRREGSEESNREGNRVLPV